MGSGVEVGGTLIGVAMRTALIKAHTVSHVYSVLCFKMVVEVLELKLVQ